MWNSDRFSSYRGQQRADGEWHPGGVAGQRLKDLTRRGKRRRWRERRLEAEAIRQAYERLKRVDAKYGALAERMSTCGNIHWFDVARNDVGVEISRLSKTISCNCRNCPQCQARKAYSLGGQLVEAVQEMIKRVPGCRAIFLTLTAINALQGALEAELDRQSEAFTRMTRWVRFGRSVLGGMRRFEITWNAIARSWHVHIHAWLFVPHDYGRKGSGLFIQQVEWRQLWQKALGVDYLPNVWVTSVRGVGDHGPNLGKAGRKAVAEMAKYATKPGDMIDFDANSGEYVCDETLLCELHDALEGRRMFAFFGQLKDIRADLNEDGDEAVERPKFPPGFVHVCTEVYAWYWAPVRSQSDYFCIDRQYVVRDPPF